jgi:hypothetical protein
LLQLPNARRLGDLLRLLLLLPGMAKTVFVVGLLRLATLDAAVVVVVVSLRRFCMVMLLQNLGSCISKWLIMMALGYYSLMCIEIE